MFVVGVAVGLFFSAGTTYMTNGSLNQIKTGKSEVKTTLAHEIMFSVFGAIMRMPAMKGQMMLAASAPNGLTCCSFVTWAVLACNFLLATLLVVTILPDVSPTPIPSAVMQPLLIDWITAVCVNALLLFVTDRLLPAWKRCSCRCVPPDRSASNLQDALLKANEEGGAPVGTTI